MPGPQDGVVLELPDRKVCREHAHKLLTSQGHKVKEVVAVDHDSILFVAESGQPKTAWVRAVMMPNGWGAATLPSVQISVEDGFTI